MSAADFNIMERYRNRSGEEAKSLLQKKDGEDPLWMARIAERPKKSWLFNGEQFFQNLLVPAVCTALILCLLITASATRLTVHAFSMNVQAELESGHSALDR